MGNSGWMYLERRQEGYPKGEEGVGFMDDGTPCEKSRLVFASGHDVRVLPGGWVLDVAYADGRITQNLEKLTRWKTWIGLKLTHAEG